MEKKKIHKGLRGLEINEMVRVKQCACGGVREQQEEARVSRKRAREEVTCE